MAETKDCGHDRVASVLVRSGVACALIAILLGMLGGPPSFGTPAADPRLLQRIVPGFCTDRLPAPDTLDVLGIALPTSYPRSPGDVNTSVNVVGNPVAFHPLLALVPYLVALDNRAMLGEVSAGVDGVAISALIDHLRASPYLEQRGAMRVLVYPDSIEQVPAPFISSMSQSGLAYLASVSFLATGRSEDLDLAREVLESFRVSISDGGLRSAEGPGAWYEEYATPALPKEKFLFVLNGFVYALDNLAKMRSMGMDAYLPELADIYEEGLVALREALPQYETTFGWTFYDRTGQNRATASYHSFQTLLIRELGCRENDQLLLGTADRWWNMYKQKMPFWLFRSDPGSAEITYAHLRGTYPHPYLRDESRTYAVAVNAAGDRSRLPLATTSAFAGTAGVATPTDAAEAFVRRHRRKIHPTAKGELDTVALPATAIRLELWWFAEHEILGLPNLYRIDDLDVASVSRIPGKPRNVGLAGACDAAPRIPIVLIGTSGRPAVSVSRIDTMSLPAETTGVCADLTPDIAPTRITRLLHPAQTAVAYRGTAVADAGDGSLNVDVAHPAGTGDYRDHQAAVVISGLDINPVVLPYLELPITVSRVAALTIDAVADDGSRITRAVPIQDWQHRQQSILLCWESFPGYEAKEIAAIDIRIILPDDVETERVNLGPLTLITGPEGLLSSTNFQARGPDQYGVRHVARGGLDGLTFLRDLR